MHPAHPHVDAPIFSISTIGADLFAYLNHASPVCSASSGWK